MVTLLAIEVAVALNMAAEMLSGLLAFVVSNDMSMGHLY